MRIYCVCVSSGHSLTMQLPFITIPVDYLAFRSTYVENLHLHNTLES